MSSGFNLAAADAVTPGMLPSVYMRMARPELFSDSGGRHAYRLDRGTFDHHLETLTSRNQHQAFEIFCRELCGRLICPNLKPATGPEGGGDSKADTETISVADEIKILHYVGETKAGQERWAFAFSAKQDWKAKVRKDVEGLAATGRSYAKVIFVTSRYAPAKARAQIEDDLKKAYGFRVEIHDRTWIINSVLDADNIDLAIDHLGIGERVAELRPGPEDYLRTQRLEALERTLKDPTAYDNREMDRVNDALSAALLSRDLERPRIETDGRFDRAIRLADRFGVTRQRIETRYQRLWASFYWFDDINRLSDDFETVAALAYGTDDAESVELIANLVQSLANGAVLGHATLEAVKLDKRRDALVTKLEALAADRTRPNNALEARTTLLFTEASRTMLAHDAEGFRALWPQFSDVIARADGLAEYRASRLEPIVEMFGRAAGRDEGYSRLIDELASFVSKRTGDARGGLIRLRRANQLDIQEDRMEIIRLLGRATRELAQREHVESQVEATYCLAVAYRGAGMLWAARAAAMFSLATIFAEMERESDAPVSIVPALMLLGWIDAELRLLPEFLDVIRLIKGCQNSLPLDEASQARVARRLEDFDGLLAASLLHTTSEERAQLEGLPDVFGGLDFHASQAALLFVLGYLDVLEDDGGGGAEINWSEALASWADHLPPDVRSRPLLLNSEGPQTQVTRVLGMEVRVTTAGSDAAVITGQTLLTVIEAVFATTLEADIGAHAERFDIQVVEDTAITRPAFTFDDMTMSAQLSWPLGAWPTSPELEGAAHDIFLDLTSVILVTTCVVENPARVFETLYSAEALAERVSAAIASINSRSRAFIGSLSRIQTWLEMGGATYPLRSDAPIGVGSQSAESYGDDGASPDRHDWKRDHRRVEVRSLIDLPLWRKAGWLGLMLGVYPGTTPPLMGLHFTDPELGYQVFRRWRERFGESDVHDAIHISIIRDLPGHPATHYGAMLTPSLHLSAASKTTTMSTHLKILEPDTDMNLRRFLDAYQRAQAFVLAPAVVGPDGAPLLSTDVAILKRGLTVKRFDEIRDGDVEIIVRNMIASAAS